MPPTSPGDAATARALEAAQDLDRQLGEIDGGFIDGCPDPRWNAVLARSLASHALAETRRFVEESVEAASNESDLAVSIALASTVPDKMAAFRRWLRARLAGLEARS